MIRIDGVPPSAEILRMVAAETDTVLLMFSRGKDSIAAYLACRDRFRRIEFLHLDLIPGLEFVDKSIADFEKLFSVTIHRRVHPSFFRWLNRLIFQAPENCALIEAMN